MERINLRRFSIRMQNISNRILDEKIQLVDNTNFTFEKIEKEIRKNYNSKQVNVPKTTSNVASSALVASSVGCGVVSLVSVARNLYYGLERLIGNHILASNVGYNNSYETASLLNQIREALEMHAITSENCAKLAGNSAKIGATLLAASILPRICLYAYNVINAKENKQIDEETTNELIQLDEILTLIEDLKKDKQDFSLNFIKEFLSQVDLSKNSYNYNYELLTKFAKYRVSVLKELNNEGTKEEREKAFLTIVKTCDDYAKIKGASDEFLENNYVKDLINTYLRNEENSLEQPENPMTKKRRCTK